MEQFVHPQHKKKKKKKKKTTYKKKHILLQKQQKTNNKKKKIKNKKKRKTKKNNIEPKKAPSYNQNISRHQLQFEMFDDKKAPTLMICDIFKPL